ncbi:MAG: glucose-1-phosphate adenylyltransferase [Candidatus Adiutrix sp.]|jgi:glucose-1-phosphate adenylyltransferase|nr:glucose-1-phosphate adenylyltransferase [Candidatus Adiutrix sp.]
MKNVMALIMAGGKGERLMPLTASRSKPAIPFGGLYLLIDITLSNCINSEVYKILVLPQYKSQTLIQHLENGWNIFSGDLGHFLRIVPPQMMRGDKWYQGTADSIRQNLEMIEREKPGHLLILSGDHVCKMNYALFKDYHENNNADVTIAVIETDREQATEYGVLQVDDRYRVTGFQEKPKDPSPIPGDPDHALVSMGIYIFRAEVLLDLLKRDDKPDFGKDILPSILDSHQVRAYPYRRENRIKDVVFFTDEGGSRAELPMEAAPDSGYWRDVGHLDAFWNANMDLCGLTPFFNLYGVRWPMRTMQRQFPPVKTLSVQEEGNGKYLQGQALDSMVAHGSVIGGGVVRNSVLSYNVSVHRGAEVDESVIMENVDVGRFCKIKKAIVADGARIPAGTEIGYNPREDRRRFHVTPRGISVVTRDDFEKREAPAAGQGARGKK